jgi:ankyrin repeat protein
MRKQLAVLVAAALSAAAATPTFDDLTGAIRNNDLVELHRMVQLRDGANTANALKVTPLHYAALYGSPEVLEFLLEKGADPNARNQAGTTPLVYAAWSFERTRLLVEHGAAINIVTNQGITPLLVASAAQGNLGTLRYLLDKGADLRARTTDGEDALMRAALSGDAEMVKLLLDRGADAKRADNFGFTALLNSTTFPDSKRIRTLLQAGSDPNAFNTFAGMVKNGPIALTHMTALMTAAPFSNQDTIDCLLKAGARVNETDSRKMTPLMLAIASDHARPATVRKLIAAGADIQAKDKYGDSALDWARKYNNPEIVAMLIAAGAPGGEVPSAPALSSRPEIGNPSDSIARALTLFGKSDFFRAGGGCAGCHHQPAHARAYIAARNANLPADPALRKAFLDSLVAVRPRLVTQLPFLSTFGGDYDVVLSLMAANADLKEPPNELTDMMVHFVAARQDPSGAWIGFGISRPPIEESSISRTAYAIQVLKRYSWPARKAEFDKRVHNAQLWLQQASPETTYEHADRILGLHRAGRSPSELRADADRLLKMQREDGGWAQTRYLQSDAYATGMVLETLFRTGLLKESEPAYRRGVSFLLQTQFPDGSWYVRSRAPKFQPYFQSGFPFDHDQWISSIGTAWAVMALSHAASPSVTSSLQHSPPDRRAAVAIAQSVVPASPICDQTAAVANGQ